MTALPTGFDLGPPQGREPVRQAREDGRLVVIGAGAVGAALAAAAVLADRDVILVARGAALSAIRRDGVTWTRPAADGHSEQVDTVAVPVVDGPGQAHLRPDDALVLATKAQDVERAIATWAWLPVGRSVAADLPLLTLQNGVDAERCALRRFAAVVAATVLVPAVHLEPGIVATAGHPHVGQVAVGPARPSVKIPPGVLQRYATAWEDGGYLVREMPDMRPWKAWKLVHNVTNAVEVLAGEDAERAHLAQLLATEARLVLAAAGHPVADPAGEGWPDAGASTPRRVGGWTPGRQSTWQSFARRTSSEIDHLNGEIVLLSRLHGVSAPVNAAVQFVLGASHAGGDGPGARTVSQVLDRVAQSGSTSWSGPRRQGSGEAGPTLRAEGVVGSQQQSPVGPREVDASGR